MDDDEPEELSEEATQFFFDMVNQVKNFYETPVIYLTQKDYADTVFNTMCAIRPKLFVAGNNQNETMDIIVDYHLEWLHAVNDLELYKKRLDSNEFSRNEVFESISYTIDAMNHRLKYLRKYLDRYRKRMSGIHQVHLMADLEILDDMHQQVVSELYERLTCFRNYTDDSEFNLKVLAQVDELLNWVDKIFDRLAVDLCKYINADVPQLSGDMTKTLQQIVEELQTSSSPNNEKMLGELKEKGRVLSEMVRGVASRNLEISKVVEKIAVLDDRIDRLEEEPMSAAIQALTHKKQFLEKRLESLENLKTTIKHLNEMAQVSFDNLPDDEICACPDFFQLRIFNHMLPMEERERLVTELCALWDIAVHGERKSIKSVISILSVNEMKEEFHDELGTFHIDENNRKIYKLPDDETDYQANEKNELVPVCDDPEHTYFYDECGRYYIDNKTRERIYKALGSSSEYVMDTTGVLLKHKEERDGITFYYDMFGRYYVDDEGKHIYRDVDTTSEYEHDGMGNLVRLRTIDDMFEMCPQDARVSEDFRYLKNQVGAALRVCIADVITHQPADPIKYLSARLIKYRENMEFRDRKAREEEELEAERETIRAEKRAAAEKAALEAALLTGGSEASYDSNLVNYTTFQDSPDTDALSASTAKTHN